MVPNGIGHEAAHVELQAPVVTELRHSDCFSERECRTQGIGFRNSEQRGGHRDDRTTDIEYPSIGHTAVAEEVAKKHATGHEPDQRQDRGIHER